MVYHPEFAESINEALVRLDRSPSWLARRLGVHPSTVSRWLNQDARPGDAETVVRLADVLGLAGEVQALLAAAGFGYVETAAPASATPSPTSVPASQRSPLLTPATPFVGRRAELAAIAAQLADPACRLLTLAGTGGVGKTRLALEVARRILAEESLAPDGIFFVALESLDSAAQMAPAIATALDLSAADQPDPRRVLLTFLQHKRLLLVLDNFEHLLKGADLVAEMLAAAPGLKLLVTSREALNLQEEWFHPLGGLDLPPEAGVSPAEALASDAVQLFVQAGRRARPRFDPEAELEDVVRLCRLVDGMPLALELAAAWLRSLTCAQIVQELQRSLDLLVSSRRNVPQRHRSMEAVFAQSWRLLEQSERDLLCQLAVFEGGFDWPAASAVTGASLTLLTRLVDGSWVEVDKEGRYHLHPLVRSYLLARLADGYAQSAGEVRDRHSRYYASLPAEMTPLEREREVANLRAAWRHALAHFDSTRLHHFAARMLDSLLGQQGWPGSYREAEELLLATEQRLRAEMDGEQDAVRVEDRQRLLARLLLQRAFEAWKTRSLQQAEVLCEAALALLDQTGSNNGPDRLLRSVLERKSYILYAQNRLPEAAEVYEQALAADPDAEHWERRVRAAHASAIIAFVQGHYAGAEGHLHQALTLLPVDRTVGFFDHALPLWLGIVSYMTGAYEQAAHWWTEAGKHQHLVRLASRLELQLFWARLKMAKGDVESAHSRCLAVLSEARDHSIRFLQIEALGELGRIALLQEADDEAESCFQEATRLAQQIEERRQLAFAAIGLGKVALARKNFSEATAHFRQALAIAWPLKILVEAIAAVIGLATVQIHTGKQRQAVSWLRMAVAHPATPHHIRQEAEATLAAVQEEYEGAGAASLAEVVATALAIPEEEPKEST